MRLPAEISPILIAVSALAAGAVGGWRWWTVAPSRAFWVLCRPTQGLAVVQALLAGVLFLTGFAPADGLFWLYALLPVAVSFVGEQLRLLSAQTVLEARGLEDAKAVGRLDDAGQRSVVTAILRRELGVMTAAALVIAALLVRAVTT
jgi:hypothetical protein